MHNVSEAEPDQLLKAAKRCEWAGVACLYALLLILITLSTSYSHLIDLQALMGLPRHLVMPVVLAFLASWPLAAIGLLLRSSELGLEARARTPEQRRALRKVNVFRRLGVSGVLAASVLWLLALSFKGSSLLMLLPLLLCAGLWLSLRIDERVRRTLG